MGSLDWTVIIANAVAAVPAIVATILGYRIHRGTAHLIAQTQTPSGKAIGHQVEDANVTAIANHQLLRKINAAVNGEEK